MQGGGFFLYTGDLNLPPSTHKILFQTIRLPPPPFPTFFLLTFKLQLHICILVYIFSGGINLWLYSHTHSGSVTFSFMNIA